MIHASDVRKLCLPSQQTHSCQFQDVAKCLSWKHARLDSFVANRFRGTGLVPLFFMWEGRFLRLRLAPQHDLITLGMSEHTNTQTRLSNSNLQVW